MSMAFAAPHSTALLAAVARATQPSRAGPAGRPCARHWAVGRQAAAPRRALVPVRATDSPSSTEPQEQEGLLPEEDAQIPGGYRDAMTSNTPLGKAVKGACEELDALGDLERQTLEEAEGLLKKLGFKSSLFSAPPLPQQQQPEDEGAAQ